MKYLLNSSHFVLKKKNSCIAGKIANVRVFFCCLVFWVFLEKDMIKTLFLKAVLFPEKLILQIWGSSNEQKMNTIAFVYIKPKKFLWPIQEVSS